MSFLLLKETLSLSLSLSGSISSYAESLIESRFCNKVNEHDFRNEMSGVGRDLVVSQALC